MDNQRTETQFNIQCVSNNIVIKSEVQDDVEEINIVDDIKEERLITVGDDEAENVNSSLEDHSEEQEEYKCSICGHMSENERHWLVHKAKHLRILMPTFTPPKNVNMDLLIEKKIQPAQRILQKKFPDRIPDLDSTSELNSTEEAGKRVSRQGHRCRNCNKVFKFRTDLLEHFEEVHTPKTVRMKRGKSRRLKSVRKLQEQKSVTKFDKESSFDDDGSDSSWKSEDCAEEKCEMPSYKEAKRIKMNKRSTESFRQKKMEQGLPNFICRTCGLAFEKVSLMHEHVFKEHTKLKRQRGFKEPLNSADKGTESNSNDTSIISQGETWIEIDAECPIVDTGNKFVHRRLSEYSEEIDNCEEVSDCNGNINVNFTIRREETYSEDGHKCDECEEIFALRSELELHISTKHIITIFPCPLCEQLFTDLEVLQKHSVEDHNGPKHSYSEKSTTILKESKSPEIKDSDKNYICSMCQMVFTKKKDIRNHIFLAHMVEATGDESNGETKVGSYDIPAVYVCKICFKEFYTTDDLQQHFNEGHKTVKATFTDPRENVKVNSKDSRRKQKIVTKTYDELTVLSLKSLRNNKPVQQLNILQEYMHAAESPEKQEENENESETETSSKQDTKVIIDSKHVARRGGNKNLICPHCQQQFQLITKLHSHILKKHSDYYFDGLIEQFKLDEAPEAEPGLIQHNSDHKDDPNKGAIPTVTCSICKQEYANQKFLDTHMFNKHIHRCGYCHTVFHSAQHVAKHVFQKHSADEEPKEYNLIHGYRMPQRKIPNVRRASAKDCIYECNICDRRFAVWRYLQDHRRRVHMLTNLFGSFSKICALSGCKTDSNNLHKWYHKCSA